MWTPATLLVERYPSHVIRLSNNKLRPCKFSCRWSRSQPLSGLPSHSIRLVPQFAWRSGLLHRSW